jgi:hypothetical protein
MHVISAAFAHPHPLGARFSVPERGAWYAAFEIDTAQAEVAFHKTVQLAESQRFDDSATYDDYLADFSAPFHDLRGVRAYLDPESDVESRALAGRLLAEGSLGIVYPSTRRRGGTCLACFRPALVVNVRRGGTYRFTWRGTPEPEIAGRSERRLCGGSSHRPGSGGHARNGRCRFPARPFDHHSAAPLGSTIAS